MTLKKTNATRIVLVRPMHDSNVGSVCRAMKNFGFTELVLVSPECKLGFDAVLYAKHAKDVLQKAVKANSLDEAIRGCSVVVGTTGDLRKYSKDMFKNCIPLPELRKKIGSSKAALVFGNEGTGLTGEELKKCDLVCFIPTSDDYPVMNLSHAVAVALYELTKTSRQLYEPASRKKVLFMLKMFSKIVAKSKGVRDKKKILNAFSSVLQRSRPSDEEIQALFSLFKELAE